MPTLACYETATFNGTTCQWVVTGTQPSMPSLACYQTATFNTTSCSWVVTGSQPAMPTLACYETATFNGTTCQWVVTGSQPSMPTLACYQTATFNTSSCSWVITGSQPSMPTLACYETATFNGITCQWVVSGSQPAAPTGLACYQTANFNTTTCQWVVTGSAAPAIVTNATGCDTYTWSANGQTYTQSGTYSYYANCQDYTLNLTITVSTVYYADADNDGYGNSAVTLNSCTGAPAGYVAIAGDCNDNNANINPSATEVCDNGIDDNCNGSIDEGCGCLNPATANAGSNVTVCAGTNIQLNGTFGGGASNATWSTSGTGTFSPSANVLNAVYVPSAADNAAGSVTLTLTTNAGVPPCPPAVSSITVTLTPLPAATGPISGPANLCQPGQNPYYYSITPIAGATSYVWTLPNGTTFVGDSTTSTVLVKFIDSFVQTGISGNITVTPINGTGCGSVTSSSLFVQAQITAPVQPPSISGPSSVCNGDISTYSVSQVARATSYVWTVPTGASIIAGAGTNIITVSYGPSFTSGAVTVAASNGCGTSAIRSRSISRNVLGAPGAISGPIDGLCGTSNVTYSIAQVASATGYAWTVPTGATIVGTSNTNTITVNFSGSFTSGNITVASINGCGTGSARSLAVKSTPAIPAVISGPVTSCVNSNQTYSTTTVQGATSYTWSVPGGAVINSGQGSKIIDITYGPTASVNGIITVRSSNSCGTSNVRVLSVITTDCPRVGQGSSLAVIAYPNPVHNNLTVEFTADENQDVNLSMRDASGRVVYAETKAVAAGANTNTIDVSTFAKGIYMLQIQSNNTTESLRVIVE